MSITTKIKTHIIYLKIGGKEFVTKRDYEKTKREHAAKLKTGVWLNDNEMKPLVLSNVAGFDTVEEYYIKNPDERPVVKTDFTNNFTGTNEEKTDYDPAKIRDSQIKGIKDSIKKNGDKYGVKKELIKYLKKGLDMHGALVAVKARKCIICSKDIASYVKGNFCSGQCKKDFNEMEI